MDCICPPVSGDVHLCVLTWPLPPAHVRLVRFCPCSSASVWIVCLCLCLCVRVLMKAGETACRSDERLPDDRAETNVRRPGRQAKLPPVGCVSPGAVLLYVHVHVSAACAVLCGRCGCCVAGKAEVMSL